jgi:hypothetical protein
MTTTALTACGGCTSSAEIEGLEEEEIVSLIRCRLAELQRAGCDGPDCLVLAGRVDIRLERAAELISRGCPPDLALRILL